MFVCCCVPRMSDKEEIQNDNIVDIEKVLQDYVWADFLTHLGPLQRRCIRRHNYVIQVPLNYFLIEEYRTPRVWARLKHKDEAEKKDAYQRHVNREIDQNIGNGTKKPKKNNNKTKKQPSVDSNKSELITNYVNDTATTQTYKFRLEKTRKSTLTVSVQKGFTVGSKTNFTLGLPKIAGGTKASTEIDMRFNVSKTNSDVIEETVTFETTSDITVDKNSKYVAKVVLQETQVSYDFKASTRVSLATGGAPICVRRKKDNALYHYLVITNLQEVFKDYKEKNDVDHIKIKPGPTITTGGVSTNTYFVVIESRGIVEGIRLSDQEIMLKAFPLPVSTSATPRLVPDETGTEGDPGGENDDVCDDSDEEEDEGEDTDNEEPVDVNDVRDRSTSPPSEKNTNSVNTGVQVSGAGKSLPVTQTSKPVTPPPSSHVSTPV